MHRTRPRTVELDEQDTLPGSEHEPAVFDRYDDTITGEDRTQMCMRIAIIMRIAFAIGNEPIEHTLEVVCDRTVGMLVDDDATRRMEC